MIRFIRTTAFLSSLALLLLFCIQTISAQEDNRVAIVIRYDDDSVASRCVTFQEEQITGYEALRRSDLALNMDFSAQGGKVCQIDSVGCPTDDCFCECRGGGDCIYWSYWHQADDSWEYAKVGAATYKVKNASVEGWSWGPGTITKALEPPDITFDEVCDDLDNQYTDQAAADNAETGLFSARWFQYSLFGAILGLFALVLVARQVRRARK
jgi:hypothetical protein